MYRPFNAAISGCYFAGVEKCPDETNMSLCNSYKQSLGDASRIAQHLDYGLDGARIATLRGRSNGHQAILAALSGVRTGIAGASQPRPTRRGRRPQSMRFARPSPWR